MANLFALENERRFVGAVELSNRIELERRVTEGAGEKTRSAGDSIGAADEAILDLPLG